MHSSWQSSIWTTVSVFVNCALDIGRQCPKDSCTIAVFSSLALSEKSNHTHWVESRLIISPALTLCTPCGPLHFNYQLTRRTYTQGHRLSLLANQKYYKNLITRTKKYLMQSGLHQSAFSYFAVNGFCRLFGMLVRMMPGNVILLFICMSSGIRMSASSTSLLQNSIHVFEN